MQENCQFESFTLYRISQIATLVGFSWGIKKDLKKDIEQKWSIEPGLNRQPRDFDARHGKLSRSDNWATEGPIDIDK